MPRPHALRNQGLFPCEDEVARRLSQSPADWRAKVPMLEREGLPRIDPIMGGRHWTAVVAFFAGRSGLNRIEVSQHDGAENLDAL